MSDDRTIEIIGIIQKDENKSVLCFDTSYMGYLAAVAELSVYHNQIIACKLVSDKVKYFFVDLLSFCLNYQAAVTTWEELATEIEKHIYDPYFYRVLTYTSVPSMQWCRAPSILDENETKVYRIPTKFSTNMFERPFVYGLNYTDYVSAAYTNIKFPHIRNKADRRKSLPDLVFTKEKGKDIDLENTIISVNGIVGLPIYDSEKKELYIKNGANMLRDANYIDQNIVLMDFSKLFPEDVKLKTYKLSDCDADLYFEETVPEYVVSDETYGSNWAYQAPVTFTSITGSTTGTQKYATLKHTLETFLDRRIDYQRQVDFCISFSLPIDNNDYEKIPILCLGGRLFFPYIDNLSYTTDKGRLKVVFKTKIDTLEKILAANLQHNGVFYGYTTLYRISIGYIISNIFTDREYNAKFSPDEWKIINNTRSLDIPFISIIQTKKHVEIDKVEQYSTKNEKTICFPKSAHGILINGETREIVDYTARKEDDIINVSITPQTELYISSLEGTTRHKDKNNITRNEIPDALRYDRFTWEKAPVSYRDAYNKISPSEFLKSISSFFMLNILCTSNDPIYLFDKEKENLPDVEKPVYTSEYETFKRPVKKSDKIIIAAKSSYWTTEIGDPDHNIIKKYDIVVLGMSDDFAIYNQTYAYNPSTAAWEYTHENGEKSIISYYRSAKAWGLTHEKNGSSTAIMQTKPTLADTPYRNGLNWVYCGKNGIVLLED